MSLFKRRKPENEYENAQKQMNKEPIEPAKDRIYFDEVTADDSKTLMFVEKMRSNHPVVLNFAHVEVAVANKVLAFLAGATYVLKGKTIRIFDDVYMFALGEDFLDGTLDEWIKFIKG